MVKCKVLVPTGTFFLKSPFVTFVHNHIQCLMTTQDFRILKGKGVQGIFGILRKSFSPTNKDIGVNWKII